MPGKYADTICKLCVFLCFAWVASAAPGEHGGRASGAIVGSAREIMRQRDHGTCVQPVDSERIRWGVDVAVANRICCFNRHYAEYAGYFRSTKFLEDVRQLVDESESGEVYFYDSVSRAPLFVAPRGRSLDDFLAETAAHGWPSFRDEEVVRENVRVLLKDNEVVSTAGTHLGHNIPDAKGNRYCINLVSVAGQPEESKLGKTGEENRIVTRTYL